MNDVLDETIDYTCPRCLRKGKVDIRLYLYGLDIIVTVDDENYYVNDDGEFKCPECGWYISIQQEYEIIIR